MAFGDAMEVVGEVGAGCTWWVVVRLGRRVKEIRGGLGDMGSVGNGGSIPHIARCEAILLSSTVTYAFLASSSCTRFTP